MKIISRLLGYLRSKLGYTKLYPGEEPTWVHPVPIWERDYEF